MAVKTFNIGNFQRFRSIEIEDGRAAEIISVIDSNGNRYYEVDYLSQNVVYRTVAKSKWIHLSPYLNNEANCCAK